MSEPLLPLVFPPGEFVAEEMVERGWSTHDLARAMGDDFEMNLCVVDFLLYCPDKSLRLDEDTAAKLSRAFGTSAEFWINIDKRWRET